MIRVLLLTFIFVFSLNAFDEKEYIKLIKPVIAKIDNIQDNITTIKKGNLQVGKSGIVIHVYENKEKIIVAKAKVISSSETESKIKFSKYKDLEQDSLPNTRKKASIGDILVIGYMFDKSLVITPDVTIYNDLKKKFYYNMMLHPDIFAAKLKVLEGLYPSKKQIQEFAQAQSLGTIFLVVNNKINILDSATFKVLKTLDIQYDATKEYKMPFYTRIDKIELSPFVFDPMKDEKNKYEKHYKDILGIKR